MQQIANSTIRIPNTIATPCSPRPVSPFADDDCLSNNSSAFPFGASSSSTSSNGESSRIVPRGAPKADRGEMQPKKYKTQMCAHYVRGETCPYDPWCAFAHGESELRSVTVNVTDGVVAVNTLPRTLVYHESWVQTTKYVRKTGPSASAKPAASVPTPSFMRAKSAAPSQVAAAPSQSADTPRTPVRRNDPYSFRVLM